MKIEILKKRFWLRACLLKLESKFTRTISHYALDKLDICEVGIDIDRIFS